MSPALSTRFRALDGLRGVAALMVVFSHVLEIAKPSLSLISGPHPLDPGTIFWWVTATPLAFVFAGSQAVGIFFILSGFVLTLPVISSDRFDWISYYPRRIVRLYLPALASLLLAVILILAIPRPASRAEPGSWLSYANARAIDPWQLLNQATLMNIVTDINGPLWSLMFEVAFSLLLPAFVVIGILTARRWPFAVGATFLVIFIGRFGTNLGFYWLPPFFLGTLMALRIDVVIAVANRINRTRWRVLIWVAILVVGCLLLIVHSLFPPDFFTTPALAATDSTLVLVGALLLVVTAIGSGGVGRFLETRPVQWLGRTSFSLYLVHVPILVGLAYIAGPARWRVIVLVGIPLSLLGGWLFSRFVELPSHRLSRRVGIAAGMVGERFRAQRSDEN